MLHPHALPATQTDGLVISGSGGLLYRVVFVTGHALQFFFKTKNAGGTSSKRPKAQGLLSFHCNYEYIQKVLYFF